MADRNTASEPQRQQFGNVLEKYAILFTLNCSPYYVRTFGVYSFLHGILPWLIAYTIMQLIIGIPMFLMEYFIGQFSSSSIISMYSVTPALKGTGITNLFFVMIWISIVIHDSGKELVTLSYTFTMPWTHCGNWWNTELCRMNSKISESNSTTEEPNYSYDYSSWREPTYEKPIEEFFKYIIHGLSLGFLWYVMLASILVGILVYLLAVRGTRIMGKVALVSTVFQIGTTVVLLIVGLATAFHHGTMSGLELYFYPYIYKFTDYRVWMDASKVIMIHQLMGTGIITAIGSYDKVRNNCLVDAIIVAVFNFIYPFIYGIFYASFAGFLSEKTEEALMDSLYMEGKMLSALSIVPGNFLWVILYVLMNFAGKLVFCVIALELILTSFSDAYPKHFKNRKKVALGVCVPLILFSMIFCIGKYDGYLVMNFVSYYLLYKGIWGNLSWFIFIFAFIYGAGRLVRDIRHFLPGISWAVNWPCYLSWIVIIHIAYAAEIIRTYDFEYPLGIGHYTYPSWTAKLGQFIASSAQWFITTYAIVYLIRTKGTFVQRLKTGFRPSVAWGPKELSAKQAWEEDSNKRPMRCGCCHPDCCTTNNSGAVYDVAIPLKVEMTDNPGHPSSSPDDTYLDQPMTIKPGHPSSSPNDTYLYQPTTIKPGPETRVEDGLYPNLPTTP